MVYDGWKPYLIFEHIITTHKFNPTNYRYIDVSHREKLHNEVMNLHNKGWGYTKIHRHLITNGFEIGKSRTTVDIMIKKMKKEMSFITNRLWMVMGILELSGERFNVY
jgi:hypothetical protein